MRLPRNFGWLSFTARRSRRSQESSGCSSCSHWLFLPHSGLCASPNQTSNKFPRIGPGFRIQKQARIRQAMSIDRLVVAVAGAGAAEGASVAHDFTLEVDAFAAFGAAYARTLEAGHVFPRGMDPGPLFVGYGFF